jgi:hypothetical protein
MSRRPRRNPTAALKAKVGLAAIKLAAIKDEKTLAELAEQFDYFAGNVGETADSPIPSTRRTRKTVICNARKRPTRRRSSWAMNRNQVKADLLFLFRLRFLWHRNCNVHRLNRP